MSCAYIFPCRTCMQYPADTSEEINPDEVYIDCGDFDEEACYKQKKKFIDELVANRSKKAEESGEQNHSNPVSDEL